LGLKNWLTGKAAKDSVSLLSTHYADIARWRDIYNGGGSWRYTRKGGLNGGTRRMASLGAAKAVCGELARLCFTEGSSISSADKSTEEFIKKVFRENRFYERFPAFLQSIFALGGGMVKVYWDNGVKLDLVEADSFIPTKWDGISISGAAFCSKITHEGRRYQLAEAQELSGEELVTENRLYSENGAAVKLIDVLPELCEKSVIKGLSKPLFVYIGTGLSASSECSLLGASVFAGAEDTLKSIDVVFDSLEREFVLGKKRIIVPYYAVRGEYDENGDIKRYFDVNDEVFQAMSVSDTEELKITDNTAELRVEEHTKALSMLLDMLCMQVGLSEGTLSYKDGTIKTAAEVISRSSKTYRTGAYYRTMVSEALAQVMQNICILGKMGGLLSDGASENASVMFADGAAEDDGTRIERAVMLYNAGIISKARALSQIYGISIEEARSIERSDNDEREHYSDRIADN